MSDKITIQMIADMAGVSRGTVDRVLNNRSHVREDVKERVLRIINETGYVSPKEVYLRQQSEAPKPLRLGVLLPNFEHQFLDEVQEGIRTAQSELQDSGVEIIVRRCTTNQPAEALELLDELLALNVRGLSVCVLNDPAIAKYLAAAGRNGVPCITYNSDLPDSGRLLFVSQDIKKTGRVAAELMSKCLREGDKVLATAGNLKFDGHAQRISGFRERMDEIRFPKENLLVEETFNDYQITYEVVTRTIETEPYLKAIYMANHSVSACVSAIHNAGMEGKIHVVCHDINPGLEKLLLNGQIDYTIPQDFMHQGYAPLILLANYLRGKGLIERLYMDNKIQILCRENL